MTRIPESVRSGIEGALEETTGRPHRIERASPVGGGCINPSARLETDVGEVFFAKWNPAPLQGFFATEARGLAALAKAAAGALRVPQVIGYGEGEGGDPGWLALEYIPQGSLAPGYGEALGRGLAALHRAGGEGTESEESGSTSYGWEESNYIGSLPQSNASRALWGEFWRDERILPQVERARDMGHFPGRESDQLNMLVEALPGILEGADEDGPSLLHGDLWSGNVYPGPAGEPVLIDPSVYRGHREVDLAMSELFGGFSPSFYQAYDEAWPVSPRYDAVRRDAYQLYYLLVHVNLFGFGYVGSSMSAVRRLLAAG
jgi:protein-ribulosamine 3-kinase